MYPNHYPLGNPYVLTFRSVTPSLNFLKEHAKLFWNSIFSFFGSVSEYFFSPGFRHDAHDAALAR
jgi:hypothetical protein